MAISAAMAVGCGGPECPVGSVMSGDRCIAEEADAGVDTGATTDGGSDDATVDVGAIDVGASGVDGGMYDASVSLDAFLPFDAPVPDACVAATFFADADGDTFGNPGMSITGCVMPSGYVTNSMDCNDGAAVIRPGATEVCNGVDDNCVGGIDEGNPEGGVACTSAAPGNCAPGRTVCRSSAIACDPVIIPGTVAETCNTQDDDCDGMTDEGVRTTYYRDADGDTYGNASMSMMACSAPAGFVANATDCRDDNADIRPGATEICDGIDNDCSAGADGAAATTWCGLPAQLAPLNAASAACVSAACQQTSCAASFASCSAPVSDCETNTSTSATNCGSCGNACNWNRCSASVCDDATQIAAGGDHTCALRAGGTVVCWGRNNFGQLGNGSTSNSTRPVPVTGLTSVTQISASLDHTCALTTTGSVYCWGRNTSRQVGDDTTINRPTPVLVPLGTTAMQVSAGGGHTCAVTTGGVLRCWGSNVNGQLGDGTTTTRGTPFNALSVGVISVATGTAHTCAIQIPFGMSSSRLLCWGFNGSGQVGNGTTTDRLTPLEITAYGSNPRGMALGQDHTCVLTSGFQVRCSGANNWGQLGDGTTTARLVPTLIPSFSGVGSISGGYTHNCALVSGSVRCWGANPSGQLGDGTTTSRSTPTAVSGGTGVASIATGASHSCSLASTGVIRCWGLNGSGQIGDGTTTQRNSPVTVLSPL